MSETEIVARFEALESEIAILKGKVRNLEKLNGIDDVRWYEKMWKLYDDPAGQEAAGLGREWRQSQREDYDKDLEQNA